MSEAAIINLYDKISALTEEIASLRLQLIELRDNVRELDTEVEAISESVFTAVNADEMYS